MVKKRSQSEVITTVLIILLVIAAVFIVWTAVSRTIKSGTSNVGVSQMDVTLAESSAGYSSGQLVVPVTRGSGTGNLSAIKIKIKDASGGICDYTNTTYLPSELETRSYSINIGSVCPGLGNPVSYEVYPIIKTGNGDVVGLKSSGSVSETGGSGGVIYYKDLDQDGWSDGTTDTVRLANYNTSAELNNHISGDCNDNSALANPGIATETSCSDGLDNNCNSQTDCAESSCAYSCLTNSALYFWHFEEPFWNGTAGEVKEFMGRSNGTAMGGANTTASGKVGRAALFSRSTSSVPLQNTTDLKLSSPLTLSAWIKTTKGGVIGGHFEQYFMLGVYGGYTFYVNDSGNLCFDAGNISNNFVKCGSLVNDGNWHHVAAVYNHSWIWLYDNNNLVLNTPHANGAYYNSFGASNIGFGLQHSYFNGTIDELMVFDRTLSASEISLIRSNQ